jgi:hypothetical protein
MSIWTEWYVNVQSVLLQGSSVSNRSLAQVSSSADPMLLLAVSRLYGRLQSS